MKSIYKKVAIIAIALVTMSVAINAQQQGDMAAGGNLVIGTGNSYINGGRNSYTNVGLGAKFFYNVADPIRLAGELDLFLQNKGLRMWDLSVYGHYLFPVADQITVYPSVGLGVLGEKWVENYGYSLKAPNNNPVFSLGCGVDYELFSNLALTNEIRIKLYDGGNRLNIAIGLAYKF
jgi:outer membrane protein X